MAQIGSFALLLTLACSAYSVVAGVIAIISKRAFAVPTRSGYLRERKEAAYENLRDLNFEYTAGKVSDAD